MSSKSNKCTPSQLCIVACMLLLLGCSSNALAHSSRSFEDFHVHGFVSQGAFHTNHNQTFGHSDQSVALDFNQLGLNAAWEFNPELRVSGQILSRHSGGDDDGDLHLDFGLLDWTFSSTIRQRMGFRLGRVKMPIGLYNETRDVAHTHPGILLPQSIYTENQRDILLSADGIAFYGEHQTDSGDWILDLLYGQLREDALKDYGSSGSPSTKIDRTRTFMGRLIYDFDSGRVRLGGYAMRAEVEFAFGASALSPLLAMLTPNIDMSIGSDIYGAFAQYNGPNWSLTSEAQTIETELYDVTSVPGFGPLLPDQDQSQTDNWYVQFTYRTAPQWEWLLRYDETRQRPSNTRLFNGSVIPNTSPSHTQFARDLMAGVRWDPSEQWMLRAEIHRVDGTAWLSTSDNPDATQRQQHWTLFALEASYHF